MNESFQLCKQDDSGKLLWVCCIFQSLPSSDVFIDNLANIHVFIWKHLLQVGQAKHYGTSNKQWLFQ
ncbi:hypothetical protein V6N12_056225 [Hibiscus sabdariffa]|uniref:Uncharacterized protein n=1 Tax=Hibiscus sabdariffa TaxID=183260 RepID=A0ABR2CRV6_9ROSI